MKNHNGLGEKTCYNKEWVKYMASSFVENDGKASFIYLFSQVGFSQCAHSNSRKLLRGPLGPTYRRKSSPSRKGAARA